jgi:hypothetical protein
MTEYKCEKCLKIFGNKKDHYERHLNKKKSCIKTNNLIKIETPHLLNYAPEMLTNKEKNNIELIKTFNCEYCSRSFVKKFNLNRHLTTCKLNNNRNEYDNNIQKSNFNNIKINEINEKINIMLKQNEELKKDNEEIKKENKELKKQIKQKKNKSIVNNNINIVNNNNHLGNNVINNNNNNLINFQNMDFANVDKKLFTNPIMNTRLFGKEIILKMIENIYINENMPEYHNVVITDKNRGYVKIYNNGKWKTDNIQIINLVINGIIEHSKTIWDELNEYYMNNVQAKTRLKTSKKYIDLCDLEYIDELEEQQENEDADNKNEIKRCKEFRDMVFKDTINLFHDNKNILLKPKQIELFDL